MYTIHYLSDPIIKSIAPVISKIIELRNHLTIVQPQLEHPKNIALLQSCAHALRLTDIDLKTQKTIHYLLCTALDEAFYCSLQSPAFVGQSSTSFFYQSIDGGERFFHHIEKTLAEETKDEIILGVALLLLNLGFQGQYATIEHGDEILQILRKKLYDALPHPAANLQNPNIKSSQRYGRFRHKIWPFIVLVIIVCVTVFLFERSILQQQLLSIATLLHTDIIGLKIL